MWENVSSLLFVLKPETKSTLNLVKIMIKQNISKKLCKKVRKESEAFSSPLDKELFKR